MKLRRARCILLSPADGIVIVPDPERGTRKISLLLLIMMLTPGDEEGAVAPADTWHVHGGCARRNGGLAHTAAPGGEEGSTIIIPTKVLTPDFYR
jgi:hypothetical protein